MKTSLTEMQCAQIMQEMERKKRWEDSGPSMMEEWLVKISSGIQKVLLRVLWLGGHELRKLLSQVIRIRDGEEIQGV